MSDQTNTRRLDKKTGELTFQIKQQPMSDKMSVHEISQFKILERAFGACLISLVAAYLALAMVVLMFLLNAISGGFHP